MAHRASGIASFEDMRGKPIMISSLARNGYWLWLKAKFGFTDDQILFLYVQPGQLLEQSQCHPTGFHHV